MEGAPRPSNNEPPVPNQWESLTDQRSAAEQQFQDDLLNIDDMQKSGRISQEQAAHFVEEATAKVERARNPELSPDVAQWLQDELSNIDDMLRHGHIDQAKADKYIAEVKDRAIAKEDEVHKAQATEASEEQEATSAEDAEKQLAEDEVKKAKIEKRIGEIDSEVKKIEDSQENITKDAETKKTDKEEEEKKKLEEEKKRKLEEEEKKKLEEEEKERARKELEEDEKRKKAVEERIDEIDEELAEEDEQGPLTAINADFTHDKKELAHDIAEQQLNEEQEKAGLIKRIWKGNLFRKYYQKKYERELLNGDRSVGVDPDGDEITIDDLIEDRSGSAIKRFILGATEDMRYVHEKIGKRRKDDSYDGEKLAEADKETTEAVRGAIERFAQAKIPEDGTMEDLRREFGNEIKRLQAEANDQNHSINSKFINNYFEVAMQARQRVEHGIAMEKVMEGFKVYNADVRNNIRTEAHRDNIDKIVNKIESSKVFSIIPAEILAAAVGSAWSLAQTGARSAAKVAVPVGGIAVSGALAGLRERNRVTEDRARMMRDVAVGLEYSGTAEESEEIEGRRARKRAKYEARIGGTLYDMRPASELTADINQAIESGDEDSLLRAIAEARVRIDYSDSEQKDLISYSSADSLGDERMALDMAVIRAENGLSEEGKQKLKNMKAAVTEDINDNVDENDRDFRKVRATQAVKQAGKTILIGSAVFFGSQELMATLDPNKVGLFEKAGILKTQNNADAQETILAGLAGPRVRTEAHTDVIRGVTGDRQTEIQQYENAGYTKTEVSPAWTETRQDLVDVDPSKSTAQVRVAYDGWANNGTSVSDGNELRMHLGNGQISSGMHGASTIGGQPLDYDAAASAGRIKGYLTVGGAKFEIAPKVNSVGQLTWGENGIFTTTTGETIRAIGGNGEKMYKYFEIAMDNGTDANGVAHMIPLATDIGMDNFDGKIQQVVDTVVEHPAVYDFTKTTISEIPREVSYGGVFVAPTSRVGLGGTRSNPETGGDGSTVIIDTTGDLPPEMITGAEADEIIDNIEKDESSESSSQQPENPPAQPERAGSRRGDQSAGQPQGTPEEEPTNSLDSDYVERVTREFGDIAGSEGLEFMTSDKAIEGESPRISRWWSGLPDDDTRQRIANSVSPNSMLGKWLAMMEAPNAA